MILLFMFNNLTFVPFGKESIKTVHFPYINYITQYKISQWIDLIYLFVQDYPINLLKSIPFSKIIMYNTKEQVGLR